MSKDARHIIAGAMGTDEFALTGRGTTALWAALKVLAPKDTYVLVPANVCEVVIVAIVQAGLRPRYVDVDPIEGNMTPEGLAAATTDECRALIAVHNYGTPLPMGQIMPWCRARGIAVIEDCCNALGATNDGRPVGTFGDACVHSFGHAKILSLGFGGLIGSNDKSLIYNCGRLLEGLPEWGSLQQERDAALGECLRAVRRQPSEHDAATYRSLYRSFSDALFAAAPRGFGNRLAAAIGHLPRELMRRRRRAAHYRQRLTHDVITHRTAADGAVCWRYTCHVPAGLRAALVRSVRRRGLPISTWFPAVDRLFGHRPEDGAMPGADRFESTVINLFVTADLDDETVAETVNSVQEILEAAPVEQCV